MNAGSAGIAKAQKLGSGCGVGVLQFIFGNAENARRVLQSVCLLRGQFGGKRLDFSFEPDVVKRPRGALVRVASAGILFFFSIGIDDDYGTTDQFYLMPGKDWLIPIDQWNSIDILRE